MRFSNVVVVTTLFLCLNAAHAADYEGSAVIVDGDTIELHAGDKVIP
jgi:hypothetical protein